MAVDKDGKTTYESKGVRKTLSPDTILHSLNFGEVTAKEIFGNLDLSVFTPHLDIGVNKQSRKIEYHYKPYSHQREVPGRHNLSSIQHLQICLPP